MEIIKMFPEDMGKRDQYKLMKAPNVNKMSDAVDSIIEVAAWMLYNDIDNKTGEVKEVLTIMTVDGEIFSTISDTFKREFKDITSFFGDNVGAITVIGGESKAGRKFITCSVA